MSAMGFNGKIEGVLNKSLDAGRLIPVNSEFVNARLHIHKQKTYYCPNCYGYELYYREVETGVFDITCLECNKHWTKTKKVA